MEAPQKGFADNSWLIILPILFLCLSGEEDVMYIQACSSIWIALIAIPIYCYWRAYNSIKKSKIIIYSVMCMIICMAGIRSVAEHVIPICMTVCFMVWIGVRKEKKTNWIKCFKSCIVQFPYLRNWAFLNNITSSNAGTYMSFKTPVYAEKLLETIHNEGVWWRLWQGQTMDRSIYDLQITQTTNLEIEALDSISIVSCMRHIEEFSQFLSIALYCDQNPSNIKFKNNKKCKFHMDLFDL